MKYWPILAAVLVNGLSVQTQPDSQITDGPRLMAHLIRQLDVARWGDVAALAVKVKPMTPLRKPTGYDRLNNYLTNSLKLYEIQDRRLAPVLGIACWSRDGNKLGGFSLEINYPGYPTSSAGWRIRDYYSQLNGTSLPQVIDYLPESVSTLDRDKQKRTWWVTTMVFLTKQKQPVWFVALLDRPVGVSLGKSLRLEEPWWLDKSVVIAVGGGEASMPIVNYVAERIWSRYGGSTLEEQGQNAPTR